MDKHVHGAHSVDKEEFTLKKTSTNIKFNRFLFVIIFTLMFDFNWPQIKYAADEQYEHIYLLTDK